MLVRSEKGLCLCHRPVAAAYEGRGNRPAQVQFRGESLRLFDPVRLSLKGD